MYPETYYYETGNVQKVCDRRETVEYADNGDITGLQTDRVTVKCFGGKNSPQLPD
jgi:hypothetical protein